MTAHHMHSHLILSQTLRVGKTAHTCPRVQMPQMILQESSNQTPYPITVVPFCFQTFSFYTQL